MTDTVVLQRIRIRNKIIELLDWFSDETEFTTAVSNIEMWEDWIPGNNVESFNPPVFTHEEITSLKPAALAWEEVSLDTKQTDLEWIAFSSKCAEALKVFNKR